MLYILYNYYLLKSLIFYTQVCQSNKIYQTSEEENETQNRKPTTNDQRMSQILETAGRKFKISMSNMLNNLLEEVDNYFKKVIKTLDGAEETIIEI